MLPQAVPPGGVIRHDGPQVAGHHSEQIYVRYLGAGLRLWAVVRRACRASRGSRACYRARPGGPSQFGEVQFFANLGGPDQWAYIKPFANISIDRRKRVASYQGIAASKWIKVSQILSLIGIMVQAGVNLIVTDVDLFSL